MILDNFDSADFLIRTQGDETRFGQGSKDNSSRPLKDYLPVSQHGSILITSRSKNAARELVEDVDIIYVNEMTETESVQLIKQRLKENVNDKALIELVTILGFIPLAISQAAAFISQRGSRFSVQRFMREFRRSDRDKKSLLNRNGGHLRRDLEAKNSIIITWQITFEHILEIRPSAAHLLSLMSFFDRQGIPEFLLQDPGTGGRNSDHPLDSDNEDTDSSNDDQSAQRKEAFEEDLEMLRSYVLISFNVDPTVFEMHALVQFVTRQWLDVRGELEQWRSRFIERLFREFPQAADYENWQKFRVLLPHVKSAAAQCPTAKPLREEWADLLHRAAWYAFNQGHWADTKDFSEKSFEVRKEMLGIEHEATLDSMGMVGIVYNSLGRWKEAEELQMQAMKTQKRVLGQEHPDTSASMNNFASIYQKQGRWKEAEELQMQAMKTQKRVLGQEHPDTSASMNNLAFAIKEQGRTSEAIDLMRQCVDLAVGTLGADHPNTRSSSRTLQWWLEVPQDSSI